MAINSRSVILIGLAVCATVVVFLFPATGQDPSFHNFADGRTIFGIPNFYNVISNVPFLALGLMGIFSFFRDHPLSFSSLALLTLFTGVTAIGLGSAYYHWNPTNATLVWDRIPMTVTFMSFFVIIIGRCVNNRLSSALLLPLLIVGVFSVLFWYYGELRGQGDLRLYALVQFFPMLAIPLMIFMYPTPKEVRIKILGTIALYALAKFFEDKDLAIFKAGHVVSGHTIKHLFAAGAVFLILKTLDRRAERHQVSLHPRG